MAEMRAKLDKAQEVQRARLEEQQAERTRQQEEGIERARERKEEALNTKAKQWWAERSQPDAKAAGEWWKAQDRSEHEPQEKPLREHQPRNKDRGHEPER